MKQGRPTLYSKELAEDICNQLATGKTLISICSDPEMPEARSVYRWRNHDDYGKEFSLMLAHAREDQAWHLFEEMIQIADDAPSKAHGAPGTGEAGAKVQAERERISTRKFFISKVLPKIFGDKMQTEITGADGGPIKTESKQVELSDELKDELHKIAAVSKEMTKPEGLE